MEGSPVRDPVERMRKFVEEQKQQERLGHARAAWARKVPEVVPTVEAVVETLRAGLAPGQFVRETVSVLVAPGRELFPLVVAFGPRGGDGREETGASALFRCEADGNVYGLRYPFHGVLESPVAEAFVDLGDPATITADEVGNAVASFLEWAAVGAGCGNARLSFWAPPVTRPQLSLVA
jgi:hypothetical protein